jgi:hypothetical protein
MGTGGFLGFVIDGALKISFNDSDSYPDGLGSEVLEWLTDHQASVASAVRQGTTDGLIEQIRALRVIDWEAAPSVEDRQWIQDHADPSHDPMPWDQLRDHLQELTEGNLDAMLRYGVIFDASDNLADSLHAEWGYLIDLDADRFEVYVGLQRAPHDKGRFAHLAPTRPNYYPVALRAAWPLTELPEWSEFIEVLGRY